MKEEKDISFFKKILISIKDFEKYPELASKSWVLVLSYLIKLIILFVIIVSFVSVYNFSEQIKNSLQYIKDEVPNFTFANSEFKMEQQESLIYENMDNLFNTIIIDTQETNNENLDSYKEKLKATNTGIILLKDRVLIKTTLTNGIVEYTYNTIAERYQITDFNKVQFLEYFSQTNLNLIYITIFIIIFIYVFILYFISIWLDIILLGALGVLTALIVRLHLRFSAMCKIAIHSLTLPILLNGIVILLETFTGFELKYFQIMYIGVSYIYIITAILMIKSDILKNQKELTKILEEQERVRQELERKKEEELKKEEEKRKKEEQRKKEKKKQKEKDKNIGDEPQGENA